MARDQLSGCSRSSKVQAARLSVGNIFMASTAPHGESGSNGIALPSYRRGGQHPSSPVTAPQYIPYRPSAPCRWSWHRLWYLQDQILDGSLFSIHQKISWQRKNNVDLFVGQKVWTNKLIYNVKWKRPSNSNDNNNKVTTTMAMALARAVAAKVTIYKNRKSTTVGK